MTIDLTLACTNYDWTRPLWTGEIEPEGIDLHLVDYHNPERFERMVRHGEFDACELSLGSYLASRAADEDHPFTAIPVFPYRKFRHAFIYRRADDEFGLSDLEHKDVGLIHWQTTTAVWQRGIAAERYDVDLETVTWHTTKSEGDIVPVEVPDRFDVVHDHREGSATSALAAMLAEEEIDAAFATAPLDSRYTGGRHDQLSRERERLADVEIERVVADSRAVEADYFRETGIFPPMHTVVLSDEVLDRHPWAANKLYEAFERALSTCMDRLTAPRWVPLAWANHYVEHQREVLGENPWEYGLTDRNRTALATLQRYAADHGLIPEPYPLEDLFVESTL
ncbi:4,5-dihydroxyphthalate decarboxylase [Halorubrum ruber]|uniref:4,5-dihydroxyphthalate decarboxylase n=1 Tax=Halorubrum ruber TaxID=2982524 RepID=A0A8T8LJS4_9EURY|nr:4,5-dihydroxyphthalate decarboxylase [Halorubrum ruber]QUO47155.1 4,5-dihydroxyphthalate decarboxylase [Halorubrum ruber]